MMPLSLLEIKQAVNGITSVSDEQLKNTFVTDISTDTRTIAPGCLFVPIVGDNFDGHNYIDAAMQNGAICALSHRDSNAADIMYVSDTRQALLELAEYYKNKLNLITVAITGSAGKTTTKDLIYSVVSKKYKTLKTDGNFNNEIGLPLTVFRLDDTYEACVLEMGMNHLWEIHRLSKVGRPDIAVITNIGTAHIENLGSREGILQAKTEIFDYMKPGGCAVLNCDDDMLLEYGRNMKQRVYYYGTGGEVSAENVVRKGIKGTAADIICEGDKLSVSLNVPGRHMLQNAMAAIAVGRLLKIENNDIIDAVQNFSLSQNRMDIFETMRGITVINDTYNANPDSMKATIDVMRYAPGRKVCILGDMFELGDESEKLHAEVGEYAAEAKIDVVICIGKFSKWMYDAAAKKAIEKPSVKVLYYSAQEAMLDGLGDLLEAGDTVLVKASHSMNFKNTIEKIKGLC